MGPHPRREGGEQHDAPEHDDDGAAQVGQRRPRAHSRRRPMLDAVAPSATKTTVKPGHEQADAPQDRDAGRPRAWPRRRRPPARPPRDPRPWRRSPGTSGSTHGETKERIPAPKATRTPAGSAEIAAGTSMTRSAAAPALPEALADQVHVGLDHHGRPDRGSRPRAANRAPSAPSPGPPPAGRPRPGARSARQSRRAAPSPVRRPRRRAGTARARHGSHPSTRRSRRARPAGASATWPGRSRRHSPSPAGRRGCRAPACRASLWAMRATPCVTLRVTNSRPRRGDSWLKRMPEEACSP